MFVIPAPPQPGAANKPVAGDLVATTTFGHGSAPGTSAGVADRMDIYLWRPAHTMQLNVGWINTTTLLAGSSCKIVLYGADANGNPSNLLWESNPISCAAAGAASDTLSSPVTVVGGQLYYPGIRFSGTQAISSWQYTAIPDIHGGTAFSTIARKTLRRSLTYATAAPAAWGYTSSEIANGGAAAIQFRVAA